eukprot:Lankesteria_metandrocarpae@DN3172_c0_g1_i1.p1
MSGLISHESLGSCSTATNDLYNTDTDNFVSSDRDRRLMPPPKAIPRRRRLSSSQRKSERQQQTGDGSTDDSTNRPKHRLKRSSDEVASAAVAAAAGSSGSVSLSSAYDEGGGVNDTSVGGLVDEEFERFLSEVSILESSASYDDDLRTATNNNNNNNNSSNNNNSNSGGVELRDEIGTTEELYYSTTTQTAATADVVGINSSLDSTADNSSRNNDDVHTVTRDVVFGYTEDYDGTGDNDGGDSGITHPVVQHDADDRYSGLLKYDRAGSQQEQLSSDEDAVEKDYLALSSDDDDNKYDGLTINEKEEGEYDDTDSTIASVGITALSGGTCVDVVDEDANIPMLLLAENSGTLDDDDCKWTASSNGYTAAQTAAGATTTTSTTSGAALFDSSAYCYSLVSNLKSQIVQTSTTAKLEMFASELHDALSQCGIDESAPKRESIWELYKHQQVHAKLSAVTLSGRTGSGMPAAGRSNTICTPNSTMRSTALRSTTDCTESNKSDDSENDRCTTTTSNNCISISTDRNSGTRHAKRLRLLPTADDANCVGYCDDPLIMCDTNYRRSDHAAAASSSALQLVLQSTSKEVEDVLMNTLLKPIIRKHNTAQQRSANHKSLAEAGTAAADAKTMIDDISSDEDEYVIEIRRRRRPKHRSQVAVIQ